MNRITEFNKQTQCPLSTPLPFLISIPVKSKGRQQTNVYLLYCVMTVVRYVCGSVLSGLFQYKCSVSQKP